MRFRLGKLSFPIYPLVRHLIHGSALKELNNQMVAGSTRPLLGVFLRYLWRAFRRRPSCGAKRPRDIVIFCNNAAVVQGPRGYINRLGECFARELPDRTLLLERSHEFAFKEPRELPVFYSDWLKISAVMVATIKHCNAADRASIRGFVDHLQRNYPHAFRDSRFYEKVKRKLLMDALTLMPLYRRYRRLFQRVRPRLALLECGSYGGDYAILIRAARKLGIRTAEYQHGMIYADHLAYNYGSALSRSEYTGYLPADFLCYGNFWARQIRLPERIIALGNPFLLDKLERFRGAENRHGKRVLITSSGINPELVQQIVLLVQAELLPAGFELRFRAHPGEANVVRERYRRIEEAGIPIDTGIIHDTLSRTDFLVAEWSTVAFEAIAFGCQVLLLKSPLLESNPLADLFTVISDGQEAVDRIRNGNIRKVSVDHLWGANWKKTYQDYVEECAGKESH